MSRKRKINVIALIYIAVVGTVAGSFWAGYVSGNNHVPFQKTIISIFIICLFANLPFVWVLKRKNAPRSDGGSTPQKGPDVPVPKPPGGPPEIYCKQTSWAE